jgi:hypothetical protein
MPVVRMPNGDLVDIPSDIPREEVAAAIRNKFPDYFDASGNPLFDASGNLPQPQQTTRVEPQEEEGLLGTLLDVPANLYEGTKGLLQQAAYGSAFGLPEEQEQAARAALRREPVTEEPGFIDTLSQVVGSTLPFVGLGIAATLTAPVSVPAAVALGLTGFALGIAANAGDAAQRAEAAGATEEDISTAAALGTIPGVVEFLPPFRIARRLRPFLGKAADELGEAISSRVANKVQQKVLSSRAGRVTGAAIEEGIQEAITEVGQNLIAKGVYDPEQGVFSGTGTAAGYGAGAGGIISFLTDIIVPGTSRGRGPTVSPDGAEDVDQEEVPTVDIDVNKYIGAYLDQGYTEEEAIRLATKDALLAEERAIIDAEEEVGEEVTAPEEVVTEEVAGGNVNQQARPVEEVFVTNDRQAKGMTPNQYDYLNTEVPGKPNYFRDEKGIAAEVVQMSPQEYLEQASQIFRGSGEAPNSTVESLRESRAEGVQGIVDAINNGETFASPYLDYKTGNQEGITRALAAEQLGYETIPVTLINDAKAATDATTEAESPDEMTADDFAVYDDLSGLYERSRQRNNQVEEDYIRKNFGDDVANELASIKNPDKRVEFTDEFLTAEQEKEMQEAMVDEDRVRQFSLYVGQFDESSPEKMGESIGLWFKDVDNKNFKETPQYGGIVSAINYANEMGWDMGRVLAGAKRKASSWAGTDAQELFPRLFQSAPVAEEVVDTGEQIDLLGTEEQVGEEVVDTAVPSSTVFPTGPTQLKKYTEQTVGLAPNSPLIPKLAGLDSSKPEDAKQIISILEPTINKIRTPGRKQKISDYVESIRPTYQATTTTTATTTIPTAATSRASTLTYGQKRNAVSKAATTLKQTNTLGAILKTQNLTAEEYALFQQDPNNFFANVEALELEKLGVRKGIVEGSVRESRKVQGLRVKAREAASDKQVAAQNAARVQGQINPERVGAIAALLDMQTLANTKKKSPKTLLDDITRAFKLGGVTQAEIDAAQKTRQRPASRATKLPRATSYEVKPEYAQAGSIATILSNIIKTGNRFEKVLANRLLPLLRNQRPLLQIVTDPATDIESESVRRRFEGAEGLYDPVSNTIYLNASADINGLNNTTVLHEAIHAALNGAVDAFIDSRTRESLPSNVRTFVEELIGIQSAAMEQYFRARDADNSSPVLDFLADPDGIDVFNDVREFLAYGISLPEFQNFLVKVDTTGMSATDRGLSGLSMLMEIIRKFFKLPSNNYNALTDLMATTDALIDELSLIPPIQGTTISAAKQTVKRAGVVAKKMASSRSATDMASGLGRLVEVTRDGKKSSNFLKANIMAISDKALRLLLGAYTTDGIVRSFGKEVRNLTTINKLQENLAVYRFNADKVLSRKVENYAEFQSQFPTGAKILADTMVMGTYYQFNPAEHASMQDALKNDEQILEIQADTTKTPEQKKREITKRTNDIKAVYEGETAVVRGNEVFIEGWNALAKPENGGKRGAEIFDMVHKSYEATLKEQHDLLLARARASEIEGKEGDADTRKGKLIAEIQRMYEEGKKLKVYFPLMRFGDYSLSVKGAKGRSREFYLFESEAARNDFALSVADELGTDLDTALSDGVITLGKRKEAKSQIEKELRDSSQSLREIFSILDNPQIVDGKLADVEQLKDQIYQMHLMTLPDSDMRKRFLNRKFITGFSTDMLRVFTASQRSANNQLARLRFTPDMRNAIAQAYAELEGNPKQYKLNSVVDEVAKRAVQEINPQAPVGGFNLDSLARKGNKLVFFWLLSAPKSALVQLTQLPMVGLPVLQSQKDFSTTEVTSLVGKYSLGVFNKVGTTTIEDGEVVTNWGEVSIAKSSYVRNNPDAGLKAALEKGFVYGKERGMFTTYAGDLTGRTEMPTTTYEGDTQKTFRFVGTLMTGAFHHTERMSREIMFASALELAYKSEKRRNPNKTQEQLENAAIKRAEALTKEGMFNYTNYNKPRYMKAGAIPRLATQFLTFPVQMTSYLVRSFYNMLPLIPSNKAKKQAAIQFFGTMGMTFMFAGAVGLPFYSVLMAAMEGIRDLLRPDEDDEDADVYYDIDDEGQPLGKRSLDLWFREWFIPHYFGPGSSIAKIFNLSDEQAELLARGVELGPISAVLDFNIGASTRLDGLWFQDDVPKENFEAAFTDFVINTGLGPFGSITRNAMRGFDDIQDGEYLRGMENLLPAMFKNPVKAYRFSKEGLQTRQGAQVASAEYYTNAKLFGQALGFASTEIAEVQETNFIAQRMVTGMQRERDKLLDDLNRVVIDYNASGDDEYYDRIQEVMQEITRFNYINPFPTIFIDRDTIESSLEGRAERRGAANQGLYVAEKLAPYVFPIIQQSRIESD